MTPLEFLPEGSRAPRGSRCDSHRSAAIRPIPGTGACSSQVGMPMFMVPRPPACSLVRMDSMLEAKGALEGDSVVGDIGTGAQRVAVLFPPHPVDRRPPPQARGLRPVRRRRARPPRPRYSRESGGDSASRFLRTSTETAASGPIHSEIALDPPLISQVVVFLCSSIGTCLRTDRSCSGPDPPGWTRPRSCPTPPGPCTGRRNPLPMMTHSPVPGDAARSGRAGSFSAEGP